MTASFKDLSDPGAYKRLIVNWAGADDPLKRAVNPYQKTVDFLYYPPGGFLAKGDSRVNLSVTGWWDQWSSDDENQLNYMVASAAAEKLRGHDFHLGIMLAEGRKSLETITTAAHAVANMYKELAAFRKRLRRNGVIEIEELLRRKWLEYRYGITPLLYEAYNAGEAFGALARNPLPWVHITRALDAKTPNEVSVQWETLVVAGTNRRSKKLSFRFDGFPSIPDHFGLTNLSSVIWELSPYSFIYDWFQPIGDWLSTIDTLQIYENLSVRVNTKITRRLEDVPYNHNGWIGTIPARGYYFAFSRSPTTLGSIMPSLPRVRDLSKVFSGDLGVKRLLDALALLRQSHSAFLLS